MRDLISREAACKIAAKYGLSNGSVLGVHSGVADMIEAEILNLPNGASDDLRPYGKWVSVKDKLPIHDGRYIIYNNNFVALAMYITYTPGKRAWIDLRSDLQLRYVTHWMPFPEPPKEESDDGR